MFVRLTDILTVFVFTALGVLVVLGPIDNLKERDVFHNRKLQVLLNVPLNCSGIALRAGGGGPTHR